MVKGIVAGIVLLVFSAMKFFAIRRARAADRQGGCVACGSISFTVQGDRRTCGDCGYEGSLDRGGKLDEAEVGAIFSGRDDT